MTRTHHIALMAEQPLPATAEGGDAPEWIHLLPAPADGLVKTGDTRGPYRLARSLQSIIDASFERAPQIEVDINHASLTAAHRGERSDAVGWIAEMQARENGIWGRVEWTEEGRRLVAGKAYRKISPVIVHDPAKNILSIANASLVNRPNLRGLTALNLEGAMPLRETLAGKLGLTEAATDEDVVAAIDARMGEGARTAALQSQMIEVGLALGLPETASAQALVAAARSAKAAGGGDELIAAMQSEMAGMAAELEVLKGEGSKARAEAFVDGAIREGHAGISARRDLYVSMHMENPERTEQLIAGLPKIRAGAMVPSDPPTQGGQLSLHAEQVDAARLLGLPRDAYRATLDAEREEEEAR